MNERKFTDSICSLSWINKKTGLPEHDGDGPLSTIPGHDITREDDALPFRFLSLLEATIVVNGSPARILSGDFSADSAIYRNPSYGKIKSEPFETKQSKTLIADRMIFQQIVGARTVSPETIGQAVGAAAGIFSNLPIADRIGRKVAHELMGFPPIWTVLQLTLYADGRSEGAVLSHSLFPSMNFYTHVGGTGGMPRITSFYKLVGASYDAVTHLDDWKAHGWGSLPPSPSGPCQGNPWGLKKEDLALLALDAQTRVV